MTKKTSHLLAAMAAFVLFAPLSQATVIDSVEQGVQAAYPGDSHPDYYHVVFVTTGASIPLFPSNPGSDPIERAAWQVTFDAFTADLVPGWDGEEIIWRPFMSMLGKNLTDHVSILGPVFNTQGDLVATDSPSFLNGGANSLVNPIRYNHLGVEMTNGAPVMAGTSNGGASGLDCDLWTDTSASFSSLSYTTTTLYDGSTGSCGQPANIIGISPPIPWPVPEPTSLFLAMLGLFGGTALPRHTRSREFTSYKCESFRRAQLGR